MKHLIRHRFSLSSKNFRQIIWFVFLFLFVLFPINADEKNATDYYYIEIKLQRLPGIFQYEIQWMTGNSKKNARGVKKQIVRNNVIRQKIPANWSFFQVRSLSAQGIAGSWGEIYAIPGATDSHTDTFTELTSNSNEKKKFLNGKMLPLKKLSNKNAENYRLNNSDKNPIPDSLHLLSDGEYDITTATKDNQKKDHLHFYLDTTPPQSKIFIYPPFYFDGDGLCIGSLSEIKFKAKDENSGVADVYYRINAVESKETSFYKYKKKIRLNEIINENNKKNNNAITKLQIEYYATDRMKNREKTHRLSIYYDANLPQIRYKGFEENNFIWSVKDRSQPVSGKFFINKKIVHEARSYYQLKLPLSILRQNYQDKIKNKQIKIIIVVKDILGNISSKEETITIPD